MTDHAAQIAPDDLLADVALAKRWTGSYAADSVDGYYPAMRRIFEAVPVLLDELARLGLTPTTPNQEQNR